MGDEGDNQWQSVTGRNRRRSPRKFDIATSVPSNRDHPDDITTYFFTNFPDSFGANAMLKAFHYYGEVTEVVIPAKRDLGGRRFGFARFHRVFDIRRFESELDSIIIGRDKISVNLSRFHRVEGDRRHGHRRVREEVGTIRSDGAHQGNKFNNWNATGGDHQSLKPSNPQANSFAQVVKSGGIS
ncbi:RNA-binding protein 25-like, partial [Trifolium medium]|nr:RNA-binding protein 25-like [Trifolium medium]